MIRRILVTGASGFVGQQLCETLLREGYLVRAASRSVCPLPRHDRLEQVTVGDISQETEWRDIVSACDSIIHLAARVHVMTETAASSLDVFRAVNTKATESLVTASLAAGVRRFVYVSTIKVLGEPVAGGIFGNDSVPNPQDPYAISKFEAESDLVRRCADAAMEYSIVRPPLVYGPGVGGNFLRLLKLVDSGVPLPLGSVNNQRSLIGKRNLASFLATCLSHPAAAGRCFVVSDNEDMSTSELLRCMSQSMSRPSRVFRFPESLLRLAGGMVGRSAEVSRLIGSLQIDCSETLATIEWQPPIALRSEIDATVRWFQEEA
ncbi:MAG: NAD-dependent epimerase/dehydratase family protein [Pseudomonadota bacterium]